MNRVLVAADSSTDRRLLVALLESDPDFLVIGETDNGVEAVDLAVRLEPDMVAMDLDMPLMNGIEAPGRSWNAVPPASSSCRQPRAALTWVAGPRP